jgi:5,5'-dehydrodivanillate O-demethylase oxygenase subunit
MLTKEQNDRLTRVGPGTPMGELMRRYWHPIAATVELTRDDPTKEVRLLGEDLILYITPSGELGLIEKRCAHRGVDLLYGIPEENGIRCCYHGWLYAFNGQCLEQPGEPTGSTFKDKIKLAGYPVQELGGLIWAYLGPEPAPLLPRWGPLVWENVTRKIKGVVLPCNWLQCVDNALDPTHFEFLHGYYGTWINDQKGQGGEWADRLPQRAKHHLELGFERFEHGIIKRRVTHGIDQSHPDWRIGHPLIFPYTLLVGGSRDDHRFLLRVPIDDTTTWYVRYDAHLPPPGTEAPVQKEVPLEVQPLYDERGRLLSYDVPGQDQMTWVAQGPIMDRTKESLGVTDAGLILYRHMLEEQIKIVEAGGDPINTFRDPATNQCILLPNEMARFPGFEEQGGPWATAVPRKPDVEVSLV